MSNYLLLRDNKQSGPYSIDELRSKGLKPYDLVWIDGKSAAWRYPSEVEELKSFAPVVEEQPFDRFFKKPAQASSSLNSAAFSNVSPSSNTIAEASVTFAETPVIAAVKENFSSPATIEVSEPVASPSTTVSPGRRIIYVTMPGSTNKTDAPAARDRGLSETRTPTPVTPEPDSSTRNILRDERVREERVREERVHHEIIDERGWDERVERVAAFSGLQIPRQGTIEEDFAQESALGDHHFVEKKPQYGRSASGRMMRPLAITLSVIAILAAGVIIGLSINGHLPGSNRSSATREELTADRAQDHSASPIPVYTTAASNPVRKDGNTENSSNPVTPDPAQGQNIKTAAGANQKKKMTSSKEKAAASQLQKTANDASAASKDSALALLAQPGREASHRSDEAPDKEAIKNTIVNQVSVSSNKYNTGTFGGISELQLTVSNRSIYPLDVVVVEVQYIQANKKVYKTENLYFRGIGAGAALMQEAPKSSRGIKIQYRIILINSKELGLSYSGI